jgi:hypothetical protein
MSKVGSGDSKNTLYCSFCGKSQHATKFRPRRKYAKFLTTMSSVRITPKTKHNDGGIRPGKRAESVAPPVFGENFGKQLVKVADSAA